MVWKSLIALFLILQSVASFSLGPVSTGIDHAPAEGKHVDVAEKFVKKYLMSGNKFHPGKIRKFIKRLKEEKRYLQSDVRETAIYEKLILQIKKLKKAKENGDKKADELIGKMIVAYTRYFIPKT